MDSPPPPAQITPAEKELGIVRLGKSLDGKPIAYYSNGSFSYRVSIAESKAKG